MMIQEITLLKGSKVRHIIERRLKEFESFKDRDDDEWFSELCFCILTANSRAKTAMEIQKRMGRTGFYKHSPDMVKQIIIECKHRFHNNKTQYIICARVHKKIKDIIKDMDDIDAREWLVKNVKGLGCKEASHFLRNTGRNGVSILDRHILRAMHEAGIIEMPKTLTKKRYLEIESQFKKLADKLNMSMAELDLYMWYMKTGIVLK